MKFVMILMLLVLTSCTTGTGIRVSEREVMQDFQNIFRNTKIVEVKESEIPGLYEVYYVGENSGMVYYYPSRRILIFGEMVYSNGTFITAEKLMQFFEKYNKELEQN